MSTATTELETLPAAPRLRSDTLAASVVILLGMTVMQRLIGLGRGVFFCRLLDPDQLGRWDMAFCFLNLAAPLAVLGLPGSFGRYFEYYRSRQQLRPFLRRTMVLCAVAGLIAVGSIALARTQFSMLIFKRADQGELILWLTGCLAAVIAHNVLVCVFMAARKYRVVTALQFLQSLLFAVISIALFCCWRQAAVSAVVGYGISALVCVIGSYPFLRQVWAETAHEAGTAAPQQEFWAKLLPFAAWVWITNLLTNLFDVVDRYMIVQFSGLDPDEALEQVGYYHTSRLIPLLIVALAALLGTMITPHLSHDWESGRRAEVSRRLNTILKTLALALLTGTVAVLVVAPWLFKFALAGKYAAGFDQLPLTLAYCTWFGTIAVAQNYLWCAEKAWLSSCSLLAGLLVNIALQLLLLPILGLHGAVISTTAANFVALSLIYLFSWRYGMQIDLGTCLLSAAPMLLWLGPLPASIALVGLLILAATTTLLFTPEEKQHGLELVRGFGHKLSTLTGWDLPAPQPGALDLESSEPLI